MFIFDKMLIVIITIVLIVHIKTNLVETLLNFFFFFRYEFRKRLSGGHNFEQSL